MTNNILEKYNNELEEIYQKALREKSLLENIASSEIIENENFGIQETYYYLIKYAEQRN